MIGPAGFMAAPKAKEYSQDEVNEIMAGMESVWVEYDRYLDSIAPRCHFTKMSLEYGEGDEAWWECHHCGHTKGCAQPQPEAKGTT
ncbi:hypothetical protein ACSUZJ_07280 [Telluria sp. B2]